MSLVSKGFESKISSPFASSLLNFVQDGLVSYIYIVYSFPRKFKLLKCD